MSQKYIILLNCHHYSYFFGWVFFLGAIFLGRLVVASPNLSRAYANLHRTGVVSWYKQTDSQTVTFIYGLFICIPRNIYKVYEMHVNYPDTLLKPIFENLIKTEHIIWKVQKSMNFQHTYFTMILEVWPFLFILLYFIFNILKNFMLVFKICFLIFYIYKFFTCSFNFQ